MSEKQLPVLVIGGGIGGLAAAIALQKAGWPVQVFERVAGLEEVGAGLTLWPNAVKALQKLGLDQALQEMATPATEGGIYSWRGKKLTEFSATELERRFGAVSVAVHRAALQDALRKALAPDTLQPGRRLERFDQDENGVTAYFEDGATAQGSFLVGADGLHSAVRRQLFGPSQPRYSGYTAWRGVCPRPARLNLAGELWGCGQRFGIVPLDQNRIYWFATANRPAGLAEPPEQRQTSLLKQFAGWPASVQALIQATPGEAILYNDIYDRPPLSNWTAGRVTLLGDAAHPMTPNLGQGACQAIEDAIVLVNCLSQTADIPQALRNYQVARLSRTSQVVNLSWRFGKVGQLQNGAACALRDLALKLIPARLQLGGISPIIGYEV